jgi:hypothetical protein
MDVENYRSGVPTVNKDHLKNPQRIQFLNPKPAEEVTMSGVDTNGAYRDPWGSVYIVTVDLNNDGRTRDGFYSLAAVSQDPGSPDRGLHGLVLTTEGNKNFFEVPTPVIAWSIGPDRRIRRDGKANEKENRDNILSWR